MIREFMINLETDCEVTYRYGNQSRVMRGTIISHYQTEDEYIRFKLIKDSKVLVISLSHIVEIKYQKT
jgi:hypothetical protein